jgi:hypothetical protein
VKNLTVVQDCALYPSLRNLSQASSKNILCPETAGSIGVPLLLFVLVGQLWS